ncbi:hypothetical protein O3M35_012749 [Rhynocoris fuscipes]|uniref:Uroporphyrinogen-III synthase n=1 Tax=Rhynocoris fuscipes TaxID=488301 RepID=A0AAW1CXA1_9HEMI
MSDSKYCILFKTADELDSGKDPYVEKFEKAEIKCKVISVLKFEFMNLGELKAKLSKCDDYSGIVLLSPRCVKAVKLSAADMSLWKKHRIFVVGEKTAKLVESELDLESEGSSSGNAKALANFILQQSISKPLLVPSGNLSRDSFYTILSEAGVKLDQIVVYKTVADQSAESHIKEVFDNHNVNYIMYFSPSAVDITFPIFNKLGIELNHIKVTIISFLIITVKPIYRLLSGRPQSP